MSFEIASGIEIESNEKFNQKILRQSKGCSGEFLFL
jgi:hypothetical protein